MGLSLSYEYRLAGTAEAARKILRQVHECAADQDFAELFDIVEWSWDSPASRVNDDLPPEQVQMLQQFGMQYGQKRLADGSSICVPIPPRHVIAFCVLPAKGAEIAQFGFAAHPTVVEEVHQGQTLLIETGLSGLYLWTSCCKTQYAGLPHYGGADNFVRAHAGLVRCLDVLVECGVSVQVQDDCGYWEHRNEARLRLELERWNEMVAAFAGQMKDRLGSEPGHSVSAPILTAANFEHLEARGLAAWMPPDPDSPEKLA